MQQNSKASKLQPIKTSLRNNQGGSFQNSAIIQEEENESTPTYINHRNSSNLPEESFIHQVQGQYTRKQLTEEQLATLKECFQKYSSTKTLKKPNRSKLNAYGVRQIMTSEPQIDITISQKQLNQLFVDAGMPLHKQTLNHIFGLLSKNKKGKGISFEDLLEVIKQPCGSQQTNTEYEQLFKVYDRRNRGYFDYEDYKFVCQGVAKDLTEAQIRQAFDGIDRQRSGKINFNNFVLIMRGIH